MNVADLEVGGIYEGADGRRRRIRKLARWWREPGDVHWVNVRGFSARGQTLPHNFARWAVRRVDEEEAP